jgi:SAM-dependent methyltransferase
MLDPTKRFSNRVENYLKYRPSYPAAIIPLLNAECGLTPDSIIADVGSGTGFLSEVFLKNGNRVLGIEPNREMRAAGEQLLAKYPNFTSIDAVAEATTLPDASVDFVTVGQAFHWFDRQRVRQEFERILKRNGWIVIIWNTFAVEKNPLVAGYDDLLLRHGPDYRDVRREIIDSEAESFFAPGVCRRARLEFQQTFDFEGFKGRLLSASYAPTPEHPNYEPMLSELRRVFDANQRDGKVVFDYNTELYYGQFPD